MAVGSGLNLDHECSVRTTEPKITVSLEEIERETLSPDNRKLAILLLHTQGYAILDGIISKDIIEHVRDEFSKLYADCQNSDETKTPWAQESKQFKVIFYNKKKTVQNFSEDKIRCPDGGTVVLRPLGKYHSIQIRNRISCLADFGVQA